MVFVGVTLILILFLLGAEYKDSQKLRWVFKPLCAIGFLLTCWQYNPLQSDYGTWVFAGLVLSFFGDVFLIPKSEKWFLAGLVSFLFGHIGYVVAFLYLGMNIIGIVIGLAIALSISIPAMKIILPHVEKDMKIPVLVYVTVITVMMAFASGAFAEHSRYFPLLAAFMFGISDISVAFNQFVKRSFKTKAWGLPLYFIGQLIFALSVGFNY